MQVKVNENGFVTDFALIGDLTDGIEVPLPTDEDTFTDHFGAFCLKDGNLVFDESHDAELQDQAEKEELRFRREKECFAFVNRGQLWYATLNVKQIAELTTWYKAWLKVTETKTVPEKPTWLE